MTRSEIEKHIAKLKAEAVATEYPIGNGAALEQWRQAQDTIRADIERLMFLLSIVPVSVQRNELRV